MKAAMLALVLLGLALGGAALMLRDIDQRHADDKAQCDYINAQMARAHVAYRVHSLR